jgi:hypothetical protein
MFELIVLRPLSDVVEPATRKDFVLGRVWSLLPPVVVAAAATTNPLVASWSAFAAPMSD